MSEKNNEFYLKVHTKLDGRVIAICDKDLINKKLVSNNVELEVSENFYKGQLVDKKVVLDYLKNEKNLNLVGENIINLALKEELINKKEIKKIKGVPFIILFAV